MAFGILSLVLYTLAFLSLGLWLSLRAQKKFPFPNEFLYISSIAVSLGIYYFVFYLFLLSPRFGGVITKILLLVSFGALIDLIVKSKKSGGILPLVLKFFIPPLLITSIFLVAYSALFYSCVPRHPELAGYQEIDNRTFCYTEKLPSDNSLGFIFSQNILKNEDEKQFIDWNMADRPPLQIAATLPLLSVQEHSPQYTKYFSYHIFSVFLQLSWIGAFWGMFMLLKAKTKYIIWLLVGFGSTGFFFLNSVFVWPKLLAASLVFTGIVIFLGKKKGKINFEYLPFSALVIALGLLSHTAVIFTILPFGLLLGYRMFRSKKINYKYLAAACATGLLLLLPWYYYKGNTTSSDRLLKWHFAGVISAEDKRGTAQTIKDEYSKISFSQWSESKKENVVALIDGSYSGEANCAINKEGILNKCVFLEWRNLTFFSTFFAFEVFVVGFIFVAYQFFKKRADQIDKDILLITGGSFVVWVLVMFLPGSTIVHQGSYATMMLIFLLLAKSMLRLKTPVVATLASLQILVFYIVWVAAFYRIP